MTVKDLFTKDSLLSKNKQASKRIFWFILLVVCVLTVGALELLPANAISLMSPLSSTIMVFCLLMIVVCIIGLFDKTRLNGEIEFKNSEYFFIIFSLGMGIGLMTYGFTEVNSLSSYSEVRNPLALVLHHWTLVPWCLYASFTIFEVYNQKYNLLPRRLELIKNYCYSLLMMLGIAISFVLGVITISGTIEHIFYIQVPSLLLVILLSSAVVTSLLLGLHRGIKNFSKYNAWLFIFFLGVLMVTKFNSIELIPVVIKSYFTDFMYNHLPHQGAVQSDWTVYYWIWWLSWVPFVSGFIPIVSKGRTIRSIVAYTVGLPVLLSTIYMTVSGLISMNVESNEVTYKVLSDFSPLFSIIFIVLMAGFYITSSDSQSLAMDKLISRGSTMPLVHRKLIWVLLEVVFVAVLLYTGKESISELQGLTFFSVVPLMILAFIYIYYIIKFKLKK